MHPQRFNGANIALLLDLWLRIRCLRTQLPWNIDCFLFKVLCQHLKTRCRHDVVWKQHGGQSKNLKCSKPVIKQFALCQDNLCYNEWPEGTWLVAISTTRRISLEGVSKTRVLQSFCKNLINMGHFVRCRQLWQECHSGLVCITEWILLVFGFESASWCWF